MEEVKVVLDSSVAVKWFTQEEYTENAIKLKQLYVDGSIELIASELLLFKLGNDLRYNPSFGVRDVQQALRALEDLQIAFYRLTGDYAELTVNTAYTYGITVYNAAYVALAIRENATLYTADLEVVRKVGEPYVKHIGMYVIG